MSITDVKALLEANFKEMEASSKFLFEVDVDKDALWNIYLEAFEPEHNKIFRTRREHDCSACRQFVKNMGAVVSIKDGVIRSIWDIDVNDDEVYSFPIKALAALVKSKPIHRVFLSKNSTCGVDKNYELINDSRVAVYEHFFLKIDRKFVNTSIDSTNAEYTASRNVFARSLEELSEDSVLTVLELINSNTLYKGAEWKAPLEILLKYMKAYAKLQTPIQKQNFTWEKSAEAGPAISRIKNHSIGVLLIAITQGEDLDTAVKQYERIVAPESYKRPKPIFTQRMLEDAKKTVEDLGYMPSLQRRFATLRDISVNDILFVNRDAVKSMHGGNAFDSLTESISVDIKKFAKLDEVPIDVFINEILPRAQEVELLLENKHNPNMVSLIAPVNIDAPSMFKWNNSFSWAYTGNIADSSMRDRVKSAGGSVDGVLRFSIQWNDEEHDENDLDAHCVEPNGYRIYFANRRSKSRTGGTLDVDIIHPIDKVAVENITWQSTNSMIAGFGKYLFEVHCYNSRGGKSGFRAEVEVNGGIHSFAYNKPMRTGEFVKVAEVKYLGNNIFDVKELLPSTTSSRELWGVSTQKFVPVTVVMKSPNHWDNANGVGHEHVFFMLKGCKNPESPNGFYNEFLKPELEKHRHVLEALGSKSGVSETLDGDELSGVGFSMTKRGEIIVRIKGYVDRILKVKI